MSLACQGPRAARSGRPLAPSVGPGPHLQPRLQRLVQQRLYLGQLPLAAQLHLLKQRRGRPNCSARGRHAAPRCSRRLCGLCNRPLQVAGRASLASRAPPVIHASPPVLGARPAHPPHASHLQVSAASTGTHPAPNSAPSPPLALRLVPCSLRPALRASTSSPEAVRRSLAPAHGAWARQPRAAAPCRRRHGRRRLCRRC